MTITLGWWLLPLTITLGSIGWVLARIHWKDKPGVYGGLGGVADGIIDLLTVAGALIVSLIAWLIWALAS